MDAVRNLDKDSLSQQGPNESPGRSFIGHAAGKGFATAPDLVRFAQACVYTSGRLKVRRSLLNE